MSEQSRAGDPADSERTAAAAGAGHGEAAGTRGSEDAEAVERDFDALLAETKRERDEYLDLARRARADFENYRKRAARDAADAEKRGMSRIVREMLPVVDNLERALQTAGVELEGPSAAEAEQASEEVGAHEALARGVALVYRELRASLERAGVETYDPSGEPFDPNLHEALSTRPADESESGTVIETLQRGYRLDGHVLRAARVVVAE